MSEDPFKTLLDSSATKLRRAIDLVDASLDGLAAFDPAREYTPKKLEPYDALSDRFVRSVESAIRFFRVRERYDQVVPSETFRDLLLRMEKGEWISSMTLWIEMRDVRNRIVHDYLPGQMARMHEDIRMAYAPELLRLRDKLNSQSS